jgi:4-amino-4-deoxy-L-arabinose transferase-like glycosyltransferase
MNDLGAIPTSRADWPGSRGTVVVLGLLFVVCWLAIGRDLWNPDEPREAEISREMWLSPSVVPSLNERPFIEKPPLYYWTVAGVFEVFGKSSPALARSVSAAAGFMTLLLVFLWGRRDFSTGVGLLAAFGLATSVQFLVSSHWVLIDPLLMLFLSIAGWAGWELIRNKGGLSRAVVFYVALVLALWTKGLIAPVLLGCGILAYAACRRSLLPVRALYPIAGVAVVVAATGLFAWLVYREAGYDYVKEWFWVNHVQRFTSPESTGHSRPFYYYLTALPVAVLPWWVPFVDVFRSSRWRGGQLPALELRIYLAAVCVGMALVLSASTTKREIYLLPLLPLLALLLAAHAAAWFQRAGREAVRSWPWWIQVALLAAFAAGPAVAVLGYLKRPDTLAIAYLVVLALILMTLAALSLMRRQREALLAFGASALAGTFGLLVVVVRLMEPEISMRPFVAWIDEQIPAGQAVYAVGDIDETFDGIVPFVTGRRVVTVDADQVEQIAPDYLVVQGKRGQKVALKPESGYELLDERNFGPGRYLAIWRRSEP